MPRSAFFALFVVLATALVFLRGLGSDFLWDDHALIENVRTASADGSLAEAVTSPFLRGEGETEGGTYFRPVVTLALTAQFALFGGEPLGYHVVNLALHLLCVLLVFGWLRRRFAGQLADAWRAIPLAAMMALLFAVHPTRPQSVVWIAGATDLWMALLVLLGLWAWDRRGQSWWGAALAGAAIALAVLAKEAAAAVPLAMGADLLLGAGPQRAERRTWITLAIVTVLVWAVAAWRLLAFPPTDSFQAAGGLATWLTRVTAALGHYVSAAFWPWEPSMLTALRTLGADGAEAFGATSLVLGGASILVLGALVVLAWRVPPVRPWLADLAWFVAPLLAVLHILPLNLRWLIAERYLYLPLLGLVSLLGRGVLLGMRPGWARPTTLVLVAVLGACAWGTAAYLPHLEDDTALWRYEHELHPNDALAAEQLGQRLLVGGAPAAALRVVGPACPKETSDPVRQTRLALLAAAAHGATLSDADTAALEALDVFYRALDGADVAPLSIGTLTCRVPVTPNVRDQLGDWPDIYAVPRAVLAARMGRTLEATTALRQLLSSHPEVVSAPANLALIEARRMRWRVAAELLREALTRHPGDPALVSVANRIGQAQEMASQLPEDPIARAVAEAQVYLALGAPRLAREALAPHAAVDPPIPPVIIALARVELADGQAEQARQVVLNARERDPEHAAQWTTALQRLDAAIAESR